MSRFVRSAAVVSALALAAFAAPEAAHAQDPSPEAAYRQSLMQGIRIHTGAIRAVLSGAAPIGHAAYHAESLDGIGKALANAFPDGSHGEGSRALPIIWENRMAFMNQVSGFQSAATALVAAAESGDSGRIDSALGAVQGTCRECHGTYRAR